MKSSFNLCVRVLEPITRVLEYLKNVQKSGYPGNRYSALDTLPRLHCKLPTIEWVAQNHATKFLINEIGNKSGAGATFDWLFFDNSKVINFDD
jgi:hypothetical protein